MKQLYSGCLYLLDLIAIFFFLHSLHNFYWIPVLFIFKYFQKQPFTEVLQNEYSKKFCNIYRKTPVLLSFSTMLQSLHQGCCWSNSWICLQNTAITNIRKEPLKYIIRNRCSDLCSHNPWTISIMRLISLKLQVFNNFLVYVYTWRIQSWVFFHVFLIAITYHNK